MTIFPIANIIVMLIFAVFVFFDSKFYKELGKGWDKKIKPMLDDLYKWYYGK